MEKFEDLKDKTIVEITGNVGDEEMVFKTEEGGSYKLYHYQDWCEYVNIVDIVGDREDIIGVPVLLAEEVKHEQDDNPQGVEIPDYQDSFTWTFYKLATIKGSITIRWYGESNGYYSESVEFVKLKEILW